MATEIIPLIVPSADRLCDIVCGQLQYVTRYKEYYFQLEKGMDILEAKKKDVITRLENAKRERKKPREEVLVWLNRFETVEKEWKILMEKMDTNSRCMNGFLPNPLSRRKRSKQILKMTPEVNALYRDVHFTEVADDPPPRGVVPQGTSGTVTSLESREQIMSEIMKYLEDDSIRSIGVHGMGGIGKTTLVKSINDEMLEKNNFKKVIMVTVTNDPNVEKIQGIIAERLGLKLQENDPATRADKLYESLKKEDSVLIILDDLWKTMELGDLGLRPDAQEKNCKFIICTRNVKVCEQIKVQKKVPMVLLSETESWVLFEEKAGPIKFEDTAREIVSRCKGSPLAIVTLGKTLGREEDKRVWNHALEVLRNPSAKGLNGIMQEVVTSLTWSYDHLSYNPDVQLCFLYCCFFPEDSNISLADLRNYGIAEKFVKGTRTLETASDELLCHVQILKECGLLLEGDEDETVKMHDVVRDVAIFIADKDQHGLVVNVDGGSGYLPQSEKLETCKRISLIHNKDKVLSHPLECPELKSLMVVGINNLTVEYGNLFEVSRKLSIMDIRAQSWGEMRIPESISCLKNVQTLYLHGVAILNKVFILGGLIKLEVLSMRRCIIGELSEEIGYLTNLRYLDLTESSIQYVAPNVFSKLTKIEELYMSTNFRNWGGKTKDGTKTNARFKEVATLPLLSIVAVNAREVEGSEGNPDWFNNVKQFRINFNVSLYRELRDEYGVSIKNENMQKHHWVCKLFKNTKRNSSLYLNTCHGFKSVTELGADGGFKCLADLRIRKYGGLEKVMVANESHDLFWTLRNLDLYDLQNLEKIFDGVTWPVKFLGQLRRISVEQCPRLSIIFPCNILFPEKRLENLQTVRVWWCGAVQHVFSTEDDETAIVEESEIECTNSTPARTSLLSGITKISLIGLPKLKSIWNGVVPPGSLQGLTELEVGYCNSLQYLLPSDLALSICTIKNITVSCCDAMETIIKPIEEARKTSIFPAPPTPPIFESLHCLKIESCLKLKSPLFSFGVAQHLNQLQQLTIIRCPGLREIVGNGEEKPEEMEHNSLLPIFESLHCLKIESCPKLKSPLFSFGVARHLNQLHRLTIIRCPGLREIVGNGEEMEHNSLLPALQNLQLEELWRLTSFFKGNLPITCPLKEVTVKSCPSLTRFPLKTVSTLTSFDAEGSWFRRLDENQTSVFQRFVKQDEPEFDAFYSAASRLWSEDSVSRHEGMTQIWKILSAAELDLEVRSFINWALVYRSFELINNEDFPQLQAEAAWMLANVADWEFDIICYSLISILVKLRDSPHEDVREKVALALVFFRDPRGSLEDKIDEWVVSIIVKLLSSHQEHIRAKAILAVGIIVDIPAECRDLVLRYGALTVVLAQLNGDIGVSIIRNTVRALCRCFHRQPYPPFKHTKLALPALKSLIHSNDETVFSNACEAISVIAAGTTAGIRALIVADVCSRLVELLQHPYPSVVLAALRTIQNIASSDEVQKQCLIDHQVLPCLLHLINHYYMNNIKEAACWSISHIMHNSTECAEAVIRANIFRSLVHQHETGEFNIQKATVRAIKNASKCLGQEGIKHLVNQGCVQPLCDLLDCPDSSTITCCLKGLDNILKAGDAGDIRDFEGVNTYARLIAESGGLKKIVNLQCHSDTDIQEKAANIVQTYHLEKDTSPIASSIVAISSDSSTPHGDAPMGLLEELEGEGGNVLGHDDNETQVEAPVAAFPVAFGDSGSALSSSVLYGKAPMRLVEDPEGEGRNRIGHDSTETQVKVKQDLNSNVGKNDQCEGMDESTSISPNLAAKILYGGDDDLWEDHRKDQTQAPKEEGKYSMGLELPETITVDAKVSCTKQESRSAPTITEAMKMLDSMDMKIGGRIYVRALKLLQEGWIEAFMYMSDARRKDWLLSIEAGEI